MNDKSFGGRMLAFLSSLRLAVVTMVTLGAVCGYATFYEMQQRHPGRAARHLPDPLVRLHPRRARPERLLRDGEPLSLDEAPHRLPDRPRRPPARARGLGRLPLPRPRLEHGALRGRDVGPGGSPREGPAGLGARPRGERDVPGGLREDAARAGPREALPGAGGDVVLVADEYHPHVSVVEAFEPAAAGAPALHFLLQAPMATQEQWLVADDPQKSHLDLGMVSFGFHAASSDEQAKALLAQLGGRQPPLLRGGAGRQAALRGGRRLGRREDGHRRARPARPDRLAGDGRDGETASCRRRASCGR